MTTRKCTAHHPPKPNHCGHGIFTGAFIPRYALSIITPTPGLYLRTFLMETP
jgi:hypothetical protein